MTNAAESNDTYSAGTALYSASEIVEVLLGWALIIAIAVGIAWFGTRALKDSALTLEAAMEIERVAPRSTYVERLRRAASSDAEDGEREWASTFVRDVREGRAFLGRGAISQLETVEALGLTTTGVRVAMDVRQSGVMTREQFRAVVLSVHATDSE